MTILITYRPHLVQGMLVLKAPYATIQEILTRSPSVVELGSFYLLAYVCQSSRARAGIIRDSYPHGYAGFVMERPIFFDGVLIGSSLSTLARPGSRFTPAPEIKGLGFPPSLSL